MPYLRLSMDLAFKLPLKPAVKAKLQAMKADLINLKGKAEKLVTADGEQENSVTINFHICKHDVALSCPDVAEIDLLNP